MKMFKAVVPLFVVLSVVLAKPANEQVDEPASEVNYEENGLYEGDVNVLPGQIEEMESGDSGRGRSGIRNTRYRWPKPASYVLVPYIIDSASGFSKKFVFKSKLLSQINFHSNF